MKLLVFGTGKYFRKRKEQITPDTEIIAYIDNDPTLQGQCIDKIPIIPPCEIYRFFYDKVLLMSAKADEMKEQLLRMEIAEEDIWYWERYLSETVRGTFRFYCGKGKVTGEKKKILIISTDLDYNGGTIAAVYAAMALQSKNYSVFLAARAGSRKFIDETVKKGIHVVLCPALPYLHQEELYWIKQFDAVIVNVFQMIQCACDISRERPVVWWIHEPGAASESIYPDIMRRFPQYADRNKMEDIDIYAVSSIARQNFNACFPDRIKETLAYGIPDGRTENNMCNRHEKRVFAVIGGVCPRKAQDVFIRAVGMLSEQEKKKNEFWIIGSIGDDAYSRKIYELAKREPKIRIWGLLTRKKIEEIYRDIDVVVCPSLEDPLPIVMTEGMMYGKVCIVSEATGTADYIMDEENGLICKNGDAEDLCKKMQWVMEHAHEGVCMGRQARKTYEQYFTMDKFACRLENAVLESIRNYYRKER